jgi:hypothetical protein
MSSEACAGVRSASLVSLADRALERPPTRLNAIAVRVSSALARPALAWALMGLAATALMLPRLAAPSFGLLDDGLIPAVSSHAQPEASWQFDKVTGRFRPLFWLWLVAQYRLWGPSPLAFFLTLAAALAATAVLITEGVALASRDRLAGFLAGLAYVLAPPTIENYYTVSKSEPWLVLVLTLSVYLLLQALDVADRDVAKSRRRLGGAAACLLAGYFWKETALALVIASGLWLAGTWYRDRRLTARQSRIVLGYFLASLACAAIYGAAYAFSGTSSIGSGTYSVHYMLALDTMVKGALRHLAFAVRDFPLLLIAGAVWAAREASGRREHSARARRLALGSLAWVAAWTVILLPWRATFEYYLLPLSAGAAALTGLALAALLRTETPPLGWFSRTALAAGAALTVVVLLNSSTNARLQLAVDASNAEVLEFVAAEAPKSASVLVNLPERSEYLIELGEHFARLRGRPDLDIRALRGAGAAARALILHPIMRQQPAPTVRLGFAEADGPSRMAELERWAPQRPALVYRRIREVPVINVAIETVVCPLLLAADVLDGVSCAAPRPAIDRRTFQYGWEVYAVVAPAAPRALRP